MEVPDLAVVTKADLGGAARRAAADLRIALNVAESESLPVHLCSAQTLEGVVELFDTLLRVIKRSPGGARADQAAHWIKAAVLADFGTQGWLALGERPDNTSRNQPFSEFERMRNMLTTALSKLDFRP